MGTRLQTVNVTEALITEDCIECGVVFAMPVGLRDQLLESKRRFYCPNGHHMAYVGKTEAQKLKEKLEASEARLARETARLDQARADAEHERRRANGYKGAAAKATKRMAKGVCPAAGCKRSFVDVAKHVASCHPDLVAADG